MGAIMLLVFSFILEPVYSAEWTYQAVWSLLFNGLLSTGFTFVVWFWVLNQIEASKASMALMFVPVLALFFGWLQLHEQITMNIIIGALMICCGIFMNTFTFSRQKMWIFKDKLFSCRCWPRMTGDGYYESVFQVLDGRLLHNEKS